MNRYGRRPASLPRCCAERRDYYWRKTYSIDCVALGTVSAEGNNVDFVDRLRFGRQDPAQL